MLGRKKGFTLIELLVVIAIIAVLAAILFPVFARAKAAAKQTQGLSNLRQIGSGMLLYMSDYDDVFPHAVDPIDKARPDIWAHEPAFMNKIPYMPTLHEVLIPYVGSADVFESPADNGTEVLDDQPFITFVTAPSMFKVYGTSYFFRTEIAFKAFQSSAFRLPSEVNVLMTAGGHWYGSTGRMTEDVTFEEFTERIAGYRYHVLYGDMHVKSVTYDQLTEAWMTEL